MYFNSAKLIYRIIEERMRLIKKREKMKQQEKIKKLLEIATDKEYEHYSIALVALKNGDIVGKNLNSSRAMAYQDMREQIEKILYE